MWSFSKKTWNSDLICDLKSSIWWNNTRLLILFHCSKIAVVESYSKLYSVESNCWTFSLFIKVYWKISCGVLTAKGSIRFVIGKSQCQPIWIPLVFRGLKISQKKSSKIWINWIQKLSLQKFFWGIPFEGQIAYSDRIL